MRAPRYRFPDQVRTTTRAMASRMVREGTVAEDAESLERWIAAEPEVAASLERGGYGTAFTAHDLFPLFEVFVAQAGGPAPKETSQADSRSALSAGAFRRPWLVAGLLVMAVVLMVLLGTGVLS